MTLAQVAAGRHERPTSMSAHRTVAPTRLQIDGKFQPICLWCESH